MRKIDEMQREIDKRINISTWISGLVIKRNFDDGRNSNYDAMNASCNILFDRIIPDLVESDFIFEFGDKYLHNFFNMIRELDNTTFSEMELIKLKDDYKNLQRLECATDALFIHKENRINVLNLLLENKLTKEISKIIVSEQVSADNKEYVVSKLIQEYPFLIEEVIENNPYYNTDVKEKELLTEKRINVFKESFKFGKSPLEHISDIFRKGNQKSLEFNRLVKLFVEKEFINPSELKYEYDNKTITFAAAAYVRENEELGKYLYNLPSYLEVDKEVRDTSDKVIMDELKYETRKINELISSPNFRTDAYKTCDILNGLEDKNSYYDEDADYRDSVIENLLRKTKKDEYKSVTKMILEFKSNTSEIEKSEGLQTFINTIGIMNSSLLEQVPAVKKNGDLTFVKTKK